MTRLTMWRALIAAFALTITGASLNSFAQSAPGQLEDLDGTLLSNNLLLPSPLQVPLPLRLASPTVLGNNPLGSNPPSAITSSTPLPSSLPLESTPETAASVRSSNTQAVSSNTAVDLKAPAAASTIKPSNSNTKPATTSKPATSSSTKPTSKPIAAKPKPKVVAVKPKRTTSSSTSSRTSSTSSRRTGPSFFLKSTAYNSSVSQTDSTPRVTATGARTRFGVIALSRDMLRSIPYGSQVTLEDMGVLGSGSGRGRFNSMLRGVVFIVEDTMNVRISRTVDVWFHSRSTALRWGKRQVKLTILRYGRR